MEHPGEPSSPCAARGGGCTTLRLHRKLLALQREVLEALTEHRGSDGERRGLVADVGLTHERACDACAIDGTLPREKLLFAGDREQDEVARSIVPVPGERRVLQCELEGCVRRLGCLQAGGEIGPSQDVELGRIGGCYLGVVVHEGHDTTTPTDPSRTQITSC